MLDMGKAKRVMTAVMGMMMGRGRRMVVRMT